MVVAVAALDLFNPPLCLGVAMDTSKDRNAAESTISGDRNKAEAESEGVIQLNSFEMERKHNVTTTSLQREVTTQYIHTRIFLLLVLF